MKPPRKNLRQVPKKCFKFHHRYDSSTWSQAEAPWLPGRPHVSSFTLVFMFRSRTLPFLPERNSYSHILCCHLHLVPDQPPPPLPLRRQAQSGRYFQYQAAPAVHEKKKKNYTRRRGHGRGEGLKGRECRGRRGGGEGRRLLWWPALVECEVGCPDEAAAVGQTASSST